MSQHCLFPGVVTALGSCCLISLPLLQDPSYECITIFYPRTWVVNQHRRDKVGVEYGITENTSNAGQIESSLNSKLNNFVL